MESSSSSSGTGTIEFVFQQEEQESSEDPPWEEWSSLEISIAEVNKKVLLYEKGKYDPGVEELCTKYISMSDSDVFRHPFYSYPPLLDPGIIAALQDPEPKIVYPDDGQDLYKDLCKEMGHPVVRMFYTGLLMEEINLSYYCVTPQNVRAMAKALENNNTVKILNLTDNFLNEDACFHLGEMLSTNNTLYELNLDGCRIGRKGLNNLLTSIHLNRSLKVLNIKRNMIGDEGMQYLAKAIFYGFNVTNLNLGNNDLTGKGVAGLKEALETHNKFITLDLSWNKIQSVGIVGFLNKLSETTVLQNLDLSWNYLNSDKTATCISNILDCKTLKHLILRNNMFSGDAITIIANNLISAKNLETLDLSYNPLSPNDALTILEKMKMQRIKIKTILLENVMVDIKFMNTLEQVKSLKFRKNFVISYGGYKGKYIPKGRDPRELILNRIDYLLRIRPKPKHQKDFAIVGLQLSKEQYTNISLRDLPHVFELRHINLDGNLIDELAANFPGPPDGKLKSLSITLLVDYIARIWPDRKLPPSPPPEPEPEPEAEPVPEPKGKKGKSKAKNKTP